MRRQRGYGGFVRIVLVCHHLFVVEIYLGQCLESCGEPKKGQFGDMLLVACVCPGPWGSVCIAWLMTPRGRVSPLIWC